MYKITCMIVALGASIAFATPSSAQSAGDKGTGAGGTNGQQSPSTGVSSGPSGSGQKMMKKKKMSHSMKKM